MIDTIAFASCLLTACVGYYGYWRFSDLWSVQRATSDRSAMGGMTLTRCPHTNRS